MVMIKNEQFTKEYWHKSIMPRFLKHHITGNAEDCWNWVGTKRSDGRGFITVTSEKGCGKAPLYAPQIAWMYYKGALPLGFSVCHTCDNPSCLNPGHLWLGTQRDNMNDMHKKGRYVRPLGVRGEENHNAKLNEFQVREIKADAGKTAERKLAKHYGVSRALIRAIKSGRAWGWV